MSKFAVIETGGKQYRVAPGQKVNIEKLNAEAGGNFAFDKVLLIADSRGSEKNADIRGNGWEVQIGTPYIVGAKVEAKIVRQGRDEKKITFKYHSKTRHRRTKGHRQHFTEVEILKV